MNNNTNTPSFTFSTSVHGILRNNDRETYTPIDNKTINSSDLNYKAVGFLTKLLSLPPNWKIQVNDLMTRFSLGRFAILARLRELQSAGYLIRDRVQDKFGRIYYNYILRETPTTTGIVTGGRQGILNHDNTVSSLEAKPDYGKAVNELAVVDNSVVGKPNLLITNQFKKETSKKETLIKHTSNTDACVLTEVFQVTSKSAPEPEPIDIPSSESKPPIYLVNSKPLEKETIPPVCDKSKPVKAQQDPTEKAKLAAVGVEIEMVEWYLCQICPTERKKKVDDAIAWMVEQDDLWNPAASFEQAIYYKRQAKSKHPV